MLIEQFVQLTDFQKYKVVSAHGIFLGYEEDRGITSDIYALANFFVEFNYDNFTNEGIVITACVKLEDLPTLA